eukprot:m.193670 g.193670  ORF g.193670 m.193670 type:complete len:364 (+) comp18983_c0_seq1:373-1464(+)
MNASGTSACGEFPSRLNSDPMHLHTMGEDGLTGALLYDTSNIVRRGRHSDEDILALLATLAPVDMIDTGLTTTCTPTFPPLDDHMQCEDMVGTLTVLPRSSEMEIRQFLCDSSSDDDTSLFDHALIPASGTCAPVHDGVCIIEEDVLADLVDLMGEECNRAVSTSLHTVATTSVAISADAKSQLKRHPMFRKVLSFLHGDIDHADGPNTDHAETSSLPLTDADTAATVNSLYLSLQPLLAALLEVERKSVFARESHARGVQYAYMSRLQEIVRTSQKRKVTDTCAGLPMSSLNASPQVSLKGPKLNGRATTILKQWVMEHHDHPYPDEDEKDDLALRTGLRISQINNWFINARRRFLKKVKMQ